MPLLSIVIANYNYGRFLEEAIRSVLSQIGEGKKQVHPGEVELIIIDGGSTDNSVDVIKKYAYGLPPGLQPSTFNLQPLTYWVSEPDKGQSNAFNKGFAHAKGKYLTWLNADDILLPGSLIRVVKALSRHPECEWFTANTIRFRSNGSVYQIWWGPHWYPRFLQGKNSPIAIFGPTSFFSKRAFEKVGRMNVDCHYAMDNDLWVRFQSAGVRQRRINRFCWGFRMHMGSKTAEFDGRRLDVVTAERLRAENISAYARVGYRQSSLIRGLMRIVRLFDFSFAMLFLLRIAVRRIHV